MRTTTSVFLGDVGKFNAMLARMAGMDGPDGENKESILDKIELFKWLCPEARVVVTKKSISPIRDSNFYYALFEDDTVAVEFTLRYVNVND